VKVTHDFINKLAADLFTTQQEILFQTKKLKDQFEDLSQGYEDLSQGFEDLSQKFQETNQKFQETNQTVQATAETLKNLVSCQDSQASQLSQLIAALGNLLTSNVTSEIWRTQADERLSRIEDWIDKRDEAS
jgi:methyl-accepting chemotaxis protein